MMATDEWTKQIVSPEVVLSKIKPGMSVFVGTGVAEPRTLIKCLMESDKDNLTDLDIIQLLSLGDAIPPDERYSGKYRLKTFFSVKRGYSAVKSGRIDWIPCKLSQVPHLFQIEAVKIDAAFIQITPPDDKGMCSLGVSTDVAKYAIERASLVVGEINDQTPYTFGDTLIHMNDFRYLVRATEPFLYMRRWPVDATFDRVAENVASVINDGSCLAFFLGPLYEALVKYLSQKRDLGIHSLVFTDPVMDLINCGAISNKNKKIFTGKSLVTYAQGTPELMRWLDGNELVEFQRIDIVANPKTIAQNDQYIVIIPAYKVDLTGGIVLDQRRKNLNAGPSDYYEFMDGAALSKGGCNIFALPSRNRKGESNILSSADKFPNQFSTELINIIATEYGIARLGGRSLRERTLALIDIAHPNDRDHLIGVAKNLKLLYSTQIYRPETGRAYPEHVHRTYAFKNNVTVHFRPIKPSDEEGMRRLFYRFSDQGIFYRYFSHVQTMPHVRMQEYTSVDYRQTMSIVGIIADGGIEKIIAEGRYVRFARSPFADVSFIIDEKFQQTGIASYMLRMLMEIAQTNGIKGFNATILTTNKAMIRVMEKAAPPQSLMIDEGLQTYSFSFPPG
ncbi:MAG TPA: GNAT family N-acetyltransferase [Smithellaceae bacterium]|nr:GNAT family N-acetyltransferase [Smithellaceae bacterium]HPL66797.1 GNAT family N-acetyltransferase [Smithellaceae bacterium]